MLVHVLQFKLSFLVQEELASLTLLILSTFMKRTFYHTHCAARTRRLAAAVSLARAFVCVDGPFMLQVYELLQCCNAVYFCPDPAQVLG